MLQSEDKIILPNKKGDSWDRSISPPFPRWLQIKKPKKARYNPLLDHPWHPELVSLSSLRGISEKTVDDLKRIDAFLKNHRLTELSTISLRERSLQIFNQEKKLEQLYQRSWFKTRVPPVILKISVNIEPFGVRTFCTASTNQAIILENVDTFSAFVNANKQLEMPLFRYIIYGKGHLIEKTILWIDQLDPLPSKLFYFGDIDERGFTIPFRLKKKLIEHEYSFQLELALPFYQSAIDIYVTKNQINPELIVVKTLKKYLSLQELPPSMQKFIQYLYQQEKRIPQEILTEHEIFLILKEYFHCY
ncbi:MAG: Wadjet anti-phage system protein JetD domain-containing protein [Candidatus Hodarchaeota archaeon]